MIALIAALCLSSALLRVYDFCSKRQVRSVSVATATFIQMFIYKRKKLELIFGEDFTHVGEHAVQQSF